jgi:hypothetical protein
MYSPISAIWFIITKKDFINAFAIATLELTIGAHRLVRFQVWIIHAGLCKTVTIVNLKPNLKLLDTAVHSGKIQIFGIFAG